MLLGLRGILVEESDLGRGNQLEINGNVDSELEKSVYWVQ